MKPAPQRGFFEFHKFARHYLLLLAGISVIGYCFWDLFVLGHDLPDVGFEHARMKAREAGYPVYPAGGSMPHWVEEPDFWGGCQVHIELPLQNDEANVVIFQRRTSALSPWHILSMERVPYKKSK